jgi:hypothetical protein
MGYTDHVGFLESVRADSSSSNLSAENNNRGSIRLGILHGSYHIGCTRSGGDENHAWFSRGTGVTLGHVACALLMSRHDEVEVGGVVDRVKDGKDSPSGIAN